MNSLELSTDVMIILDRIMVAELRSSFTTTYETFFSGNCNHQVGKNPISVQILLNVAHSSRQDSIGFLCGCEYYFPDSLVWHNFKLLYVWLRTFLQQPTYC